VHPSSRADGTSFGFSTYAALNLRRTEQLGSPLRKLQNSHSVGCDYDFTTGSKPLTHIREMSGNM
jgi:hypothetical protein